MGFVLIAIGRYFESSREEDSRYENYFFFSLGNGEFEMSLESGQSVLYDGVYVVIALLTVRRGRHRSRWSIIPVLSTMTTRRFSR